MTRHLLPMIEQAREDGASLKRLVNISSGLGHSTNAVQCAYSASKWGVEALSKSTAQALKAEGLGKRVVCVPLAPGVIRSEMNPLAWAKPAEEWAPEAARFIIGLGPKDSGASLSVPGYYSAEYVRRGRSPTARRCPSRSRRGERDFVCENFYRLSPVRVDGALVGLDEALVRRVVRAADAARAALDVGVALLSALLLDVDARPRHLVD